MSDTRIASTEIHRLAEQMRSALMRHALRPTVYVYKPRGDDPLYHVGVEAPYGQFGFTEGQHIELMEVCTGVEESYVMKHGVDIDLQEIVDNEPETDPVPETAP